MPIGYNVVWSDEADKNVASILAYLENNRSEKIANDFYAELLKRVDLISRQPTAFAISH